MEYVKESTIQNQSLVDLNQKMNDLGSSLKSTSQRQVKTAESLTQIFSQKDLLMQSLIIFFKERKNLDKVIPIITGKSNISLRILDWFVTNFSKKNNIN